MIDQNSQILADRGRLRLNGKGRGWLTTGLIAGLSLSVLTATAVAPSGAKGVATERISESLGTPAFSLVAAQEAIFVQEDRVRPGDTVSRVFQRLGIDDASADQFLRSSEEGQRAIGQLRAGKRVSAKIRSNGELVNLTLPLTGTAGEFTITRDGDGFAVQEDDQSGTTQVVEMRAGEIVHSLFGAADAAGLPDAVATRLAGLFGTEIDFHSDLRKGDTFSVVYETTLQPDGHTAGTGRILAAEFVNKRKRHTVMLYRDANGREDYYTDAGISLKQAFLRSPLEFTRVSSGFSRRFHPIKKQWRQHKGVDFAAPSGTAIKATSNAKVDFVGKQRGYGNVVILRHRDKVKTLYAHMRGFAKNIRKGASVTQGDVIGYVGQTGWATGPHVHYEFRVANVPKDPLSVALPTANPLSKNELADFRRSTESLRARLHLLNYRDSISG